MSGVLERIATALETIASKMDSAPAAEAAPAKPAKVEKTEKPEKAAKPAATSKPSVTAEQMQAKLIEVKENSSVEETKKLYTVHGYKAMKDIQPEHYDVIFKAAEAKLAELAGGGSDDDNGL